MPCEVTNVFSTAEDNQTEILLHLFSGPKEVAAENRSLGTYAIVGIPPLPRGRPQVAVTLRAVGGDLILSARDASHSLLRIQRRPA
jgi:molecular chaperone DnaK